MQLTTFPKTHTQLDSAYRVSKIRDSVTRLVDADGEVRREPTPKQFDHSVGLIEREVDGEYLVNIRIDPYAVQKSR